MFRLPLNKLFDLKYGLQAIFHNEGIFAIPAIALLKHVTNLTKTLSSREGLANGQTGFIIQWFNLRRIHDQT